MADGMEVKVEGEQVIPVVESPVVETPKVEEAPKEDLVSRASKVKLDAPKAETNPFGLSKEDYDKVQTDPTLSKFYKSMQADYIRKTQEAADLKRQADAELKQSANWTPERINKLLNDPNFVNAAQQAASLNNPPNSGLTDQEYSALTDKEKAQLSSMQSELHQMKLQNWQMQQRQQDEVLRNKYANYAPDIVDTTVHKLVNNEIQATREDLWKVLDYDQAVQRAYQLGKMDRQLDTQEKQQALSPDGYSATPQRETLKAEPNESSQAFFKRLANKRIAEFKGNNK